MNIYIKNIYNKFIYYISSIIYIYIGCDKLLECMREKKDKMNNFISSGVTSAFLQRKEGNIG